MTREIPTATLNSLDDPVFKPFFALELLFNSQAVRVWTGLGELTAEGETWLGAGEVLSISPVEETSELSIKGATVSLSGVPSEYLALAIDEPYQGRVAKIYFGNFVAGSPTDLTEIFSGYMDQLNIDEGEESSTIQLRIENKLIDLERPRVARFTSQYQKSKFSGDKGLDFLEDLQDKELFWGGPNPNTKN